MKSTSAIPGMSIHEVKKYLNETRSKVDNVNELEPYILTEKLSNNMEISTFVYNLTTGLHQKRTRKRVDKSENNTSNKKK